MPQRVKKQLEKIYFTHGIFTFLLFFAPLLPNVVESHTKLYLNILKLTNIDPYDAEEAIRVIFGQRGLSAYQHFKASNPTIIRPTQILRQFYHDNQPEIGVDLMAHSLLDESQRLYPHSDVFRATLISETPYIFSLYHQPKYQELRSKVIKILYVISLTDKSLEPRLKLVDAAKTLLRHTAATENAYNQKKINAQLKTLEAKIKAELAGKSSVASAPPINIGLNNITNHHLLTQPDIDLLIKSLEQLAKVPAPDIKDKASYSLSEISTYNLQLCS